MIEASPKRDFSTAIIAWHYTTALRGLFRAWRNFLVFLLYYFPVVQLLKTFFSHWRRSVDSYGRGLDIERWLHSFLGNMISRGVGAFARAVIIIVGIIAEIIVFFTGGFVILIWIFLPILLILGFFAGIGLLFGL